MKKKPRSKKKNGDYNKGQYIALIIIVIVLLHILRRCDFDEFKDKSWQPWDKKPVICQTLKLSKSECAKKLRKEIPKLVKKIPDLGDIKEKYSCIQKDASNVETAKWTLSVSKTMGTFAQKYFVENSCCPERGKRLAFYHKEVVDIHDH